MGIDPLLVMTFGNPLYDGGKAPATPAGREAYARYGEELLKHYGSQIRWLEVWNEYNGTWCGGEAEKDRPKYYAEMIKAAYPKIKALRPDVKVLGFAAVVIPLPYLEGIFKHGGLQAMDAVVIHPYRGQPEGVEIEVAELQKLIRKYNDGKDKPIWVTETGSWDGSEYDWEQGKGLNLLGRSNIARYLVRQYALLLSTGTVEKVYWYLTRDYNTFKTMGLLGDPKDPRGRYAVHPAYVAYATLIRQLQGTSRRGGPRPAVSPMSCSSTAAARKRGSAGPPSRAHRTGSRRALTVVNMMGVEEVLSPVAGQVYLTLTESPVYVKGKVDGIIEGGHFRLAGPQTVNLLADYGFDYTVNDAAVRGGGRSMSAASRTPLPAKAAASSSPVRTRPNRTKTCSGTDWSRAASRPAAVACGSVSRIRFPIASRPLFRPKTFSACGLLMPLRPRITR